MNMGIIKSLAAVEGYIELDLPRYALHELTRMRGKFAMEDLKLFTPITCFLRGRIDYALADYDGAIIQLSNASRFLAPDNKPALELLSKCYRLNGQIAQAERVAVVAATRPACDISVFHVGSVR